jgi:cobalt-zinc-cadmium efflux system outer membrane protein
MFIRFARALGAAHLALAAALASPIVLAQAPDAGEPLSLRAAIERTLARNPELAGFGYRLRAQNARVEAAYLRPPLELRGDIEDFLGTGETSGFDSAEATFSIARVVELGDKRDYRSAAAEASSSLLEIERAGAELDVLAEVTRRFIHVASDQEQLRATERATELARETVQTSEARVAAARAPELELRRARVTLARAEIDQEHAEHELLASRRALAAMWGDREAGFGRIEADLYALPAAESFETLTARLARNPDFLRFASAARVRDAEIRLAESRARSDLELSAGVRRLRDTDDYALVFGIAMPLGRAARAESSVAEAEALRGLNDADSEAHGIRIEAQLFAIYQELRHALTEAETLRSGVLPEMEAALNATREAFDQGRYSYLEWVDAQRELIDVERALIEASANAHLYRAEVERLTGEPLSTGNP